MSDSNERLLKLLDEYGTRLHTLLTRLTLRADSAEELLQDVFLRLMRSEGFADSPSPERYLFRSAINLAFDWRKRRQLRGISGRLSGREVSPHPSPEQQAIQHEQVERVLAAMEQLSESDRELLTLRFIDGASNEWLAERFDTTPHRVRALCAKAVSRLRQLVHETSTPQSKENSHVHESRP